jgi:hypothetical protein
MPLGKERQAWKSLRDSHICRPAATTFDVFTFHLPGLLANHEMAQRSNPAFRKSAEKNNLSRLAI